MAGNVNSAPTRNKNSATKFKALFLSQRKTKQDPTDFGTNPAIVPMTIKLSPGQSGDALQVMDSSEVVLAKINSAGQLVQTAAASLASPFGLGGQLMMARAKYDFAVDGGAISTITLATNAVIPANAIVFGGIINPTTAFVGATATIGLGTLAGSTASSLKAAATAVSVYSIDALVATIPVFTAGSAFKMSAAGQITMTIAVAALTAGVAEITLFYIVAAAA
jgi:hypothetical protein